jgi:hypothetical protein
VNNDHIEISRHTFEQILDSYFRFYEDRYHRTVVTKTDFLNEVLLQDVTMGPSVFQAVREWEATKER